MKDFRQLQVWTKAHNLTLYAYQLTKTFPREEMFGLTSQIRRGTSSIPANIAEGCGRNGNAELERFLYIASGSASELEYHWLLAHDLHYTSDAEYKRAVAMTTEVRRMLTALIGRVHSDRALAAEA